LSEIYSEKSGLKVPGGTLIPVIAVPFLLPILTSLFFLKSYLSLPGIYLIPIVTSVILAILAVWALKQDRVFLEDIGLRFNKAGEALALMAAAWVIIGALSYLDGKQPIFIPLFVVKNWLFVGMGEELLFRGYLLNRLAKDFRRSLSLAPVMAAIILSSIIFAAAHIPIRLFERYPLPDLLNYLVMVFFFGLFFCYVFLRTRNIILTGLIHGSINTPFFIVQPFLQVIAFTAVIELYLWLKKRAGTGRRQGALLVDPAPPRASSFVIYRQEEDGRISSKDPAQE
jgi:uncharacterized protein